MNWSVRRLATAGTSRARQLLNQKRRRRGVVLLHQPGPVHVDRARADREPLADLLARQALDQQRGDLALARREVGLQLPSRGQVLEAPDARGMRLPRVER